MKIHTFEEKWGRGFPVGFWERKVRIWGEQKKPPAGWDKAKEGSNSLDGTGAP
jgi:hypothetical protein